MVEDINFEVPLVSLNCFKANLFRVDDGFGVDAVVDQLRRTKPIGKKPLGYFPEDPFACKGVKEDIMLQMVFVNEYFDYRACPLESYGRCADR